MTSESPPSAERPASVRPIPDSEFARFYHWVFLLDLANRTVVSTAFFLIARSELPEDDPIRLVFMYAVPAFLLVTAVPGYFILRAILRKKCRKDAYYLVSDDCLRRVFPPVLSRTVRRANVEHVEEWSPHGPLVLILKRGRAMKIPGDIERYEELRDVLMTWR